MGSEMCIRDRNMSKKVVVHIPATSANLGPGFDVLGLGLALYNLSLIHI